MNKIVKIVLIVIGLIGAALWFVLPSNEMAEADPAGAAASGTLNAMMWVTYILLGVATVVSLGFALLTIVSNPAGLKKTLFAVVGFIIAAGIAYAISSGTDVSEQYASMTTEGTVKYIGMGIYLFLILFVVAVVMMIVPSFKKILGK